MFMCVSLSVLSSSRAGTLSSSCCTSSAWMRAWHLAGCLSSCWHASGAPGPNITCLCHSPFLPPTRFSHRHSVFNSTVLSFLVYQCPFHSVVVVVLSFSHFCVIDIFITAANPLSYLPQFFLCLNVYEIETLCHSVNGKENRCYLS